MTRFDYNALASKQASKRHNCALFTPETEYTHIQDHQQKREGFLFAACRWSFLYLANGGERAVIGSLLKGVTVYG